MFLQTLVRFAIITWGAVPPMDAGTFSHVFRACATNSHHPQPGSNLGAWMRPAFYSFTEARGTVAWHAVIVGI